MSSVLIGFPTKKATHERGTWTTDAAGGTDATWATVRASIPCVIWPAGSAPNMTAMERKMVGGYVICVDGDPKAMKQDRFKIGDAYYVVNDTERWEMCPYNYTLIGTTLKDT